MPEACTRVETYACIHAEYDGANNVTHQVVLVSRRIQAIIDARIVLCVIIECLGQTPCSIG